MGCSSGQQTVGGGGWSEQWSDVAGTLLVKNKQAGDWIWRHLEIEEMWVIFIYFWLLAEWITDLKQHHSQYIMHCCDKQLYLASYFMRLISDNCVLYASRVINDHSLKCFNSGEHHYVSQIAPHIDLFFRLGAIFILKPSLAKQLHQLADLILLPLLCFRWDHRPCFASCCCSLLR